jgi:hypothetical protein
MNVSLLSKIILALRAYSKERHVTVYFAIATGFFQYAIQAGEQGMLDFDFASAYTAYQVVMVPAGDLVAKMSAACMGGMDQPVFHQEIQRTIDRRLGEPWQFTPRLYIDFAGREMSTHMMEDVQNSHPLRCHSKTA